MHAQTMHVAIIIVSYNTRDHLRRCLQSLEEHALPSHAGDANAGHNVTQPYTQPYPQSYTVQVVVVDNASHDDSAQMVSAEFPHVHLIQSGRNLGFTGGNNLALRALGFNLTATGAQSPARIEPKPDYVWLLNPDTEATPDALPRLVAFLESTPRAAACGPLLRYGDGVFQHGAFTFPDWRQVALDLGPIPWLPGLRGLWLRLLHSRINGRYPAQWWQGSEPFPVDFVLGAAMLVRGSLIDSLGGLDDAYFMYCEEMDWCLRMHQAGWEVYAVPAATIIHHEGQSSRQVRHAATVRLWRSRFHFLRKHATRYTPAHRQLIRLLAHLHWRVARMRVRGAFRHGGLNGIEAAQELAALDTLLALE